MIKKLLSFGMAEGLSLGINWLLTLSLAMLLSAKDYGVLSLIIAIQGFLVPIMIFGQDRTILRFYKNKELKGFDVLFVSLVIVTVTYNIFFFLSITEISEKYLLRINIDDFKLFLIASIFFLVLIKVYLSILRVEGNGRLYAYYRLGHQILRAILVVTMLLYFRDAEYYLVASMVSALVFVLLQAKGWHVRMNGIVNQKIIGRMMLFGWPLIFHSMSSITLTYIDRFMIEYYLDVSAVGNYSLAYMLGSGVSLIYGLIAIYFEPFIYKKGPGNNSEFWLGLYTKVSLILVSIGGVFTLIISMVLFEYFFKEGYSESPKLIPIILVAHIFNSIFFQSNYRLAIVEKTGAIATGTVLAAISNIVMNNIFIPQLGLKGAALATFFSYMLLSIFLYTLSCIKTGLSIRQQDNFILFVFVVLLLLASILIDNELIYYFILIVLIISVSVNIYKNDQEAIRKNIFNEKQ
jgi:O-antigen/teichoic acid export membrane protein